MFLISQTVLTQVNRGAADTHARANLESLSADLIQSDAYPTHVCHQRVGALPGYAAGLASDASAWTLEKVA